MTNSGGVDLTPGVVRMQFDMASQEMGGVLNVMNSGLVVNPAAGTAASSSVPTSQNVMHSRLLQLICNYKIAAENRQAAGISNGSSSSSPHVSSLDVSTRPGVISMSPSTMSTTNSLDYSSLPPSPMLVNFSNLRGNGAVFNYTVDSIGQPLRQAASRVKVAPPRTVSSALGAQPPPLPLPPPPRAPSDAYDTATGDLRIQRFHDTSSLGSTSRKDNTVLASSHSVDEPTDNNMMSAAFHLKAENNLLGTVDCSVHDPTNQQYDFIRFLNKQPTLLSDYVTLPNNSSLTGDQSGCGLYTSSSDYSLGIDQNDLASSGTLFSGAFQDARGICDDLLSSETTAGNFRTTRTYDGCRCGNSICNGICQHYLDAVIDDNFSSQVPFSHHVNDNRASINGGSLKAESGQAAASHFHHINTAHSRYNVAGQSQCMDDDDDNFDDILDVVDVVISDHNISLRSDIATVLINEGSDRATSDPREVFSSPARFPAPSSSTSSRPEVNVVSSMAQISDFCPDWSYTEVWSPQTTEELCMLHYLEMYI